MQDHRNMKNPAHDRLNTSAGIAMQPGRIEEGQVCREMTEEERENRWLIGRPVIFVPPQDCKNDTTPDFYAATITKVNGKSNEHGQVRTVDLVTFGPNSMYFQHNVPFHGGGSLKPGHWSYRN